MGTPDKADWPEGYKLAQSKSRYLITKIITFLNRKEST